MRYLLPPIHPLQDDVSTQSYLTRSALQPICGRVTRRWEGPLRNVTDLYTRAMDAMYQVSQPSCASLLTQFRHHRRLPHMQALHSKPVCGPTHAGGGLTSGATCLAARMVQTLDLS